MTSIKKCFVLALFVYSLINEVNAQQDENTPQSLDAKQQSIVTIAAFTALGDLEQLLSIIESNVGQAQAEAGREVLSQVLSSRE